MGEVLTNYHNIEVPASADPYQLVSDLRRMGVSVGQGINAGAEQAAAAKLAGSSLASTTDLDTITTPGVYFQASSTAATPELHYPTARAGTVQVQRWSATGDRLIQVYYQWDAKAFYLRNLYNGAWSEWTWYTNADQTKAFAEDATAKGAPAVVKVTSYGADPTGVKSAMTSVRSALAATPAGGTLHFPTGTYRNTYTSITGESNFLVIDKPVRITADPGTVLQNFPILIKGAFDAPVPLGATAEDGDQVLTTATAHGWAAGDHVQVLSQYNPYTEAAGVWQLGSVNPTNGTIPDCTTGEIHRIAAVPATTQVKLYDQLFYGGYTTAAQARRIRTIDGVTFDGLTFENTIDGYRGIVARGASNLTIRRCTFRSGENTGFGIRVFDSFETRIEDCTFQKNLGTFSGSSWNTVILGGGTTGATVTGCRVIGEAQAIDVTPNAATTTAADPGGTGAAYRTAQRVRILDNSFSRCSDSFTAHPGVMDVLVQGNHVAGGSTGFRMRAKRSVVRGNTVRTSRCGVSLEAFCDESVVAGNTFQHITSAVWPSWYVGVTYTSSSSEITNGNNHAVTITGNDITVQPDVSSGGWAVSLSHSEPTSVDVTLTDEWRNRLSRITVKGNTVHGGTVWVGAVINGARILGNTFTGGTVRTHYIDVEGAASVIDGNTFDGEAGHILTGPEPRAGYTYDTRHRIGGNTTTDDALSATLTNATVMGGATPTATEIAPGMTRITF